MFLLDWQLNEFCSSSDVDKLIAVKIFTFNAEKNIAIISWYHQHDRRRLTAPEGVFVYDYLDTVVTVAKLTRRVCCNKDVGLCLNRREKPVSLGIVLATLPFNPVVALALRCETHFRRALSISFHCGRGNFIVLITLKLELPGPLSRRPLLRSRREGSRPLTQQAKLVPFHFPAIRVEPDFIPVIACDLYDAFGRDRLVVSIERFDIEGNFVQRAIDILFGTCIDVVALSRDPHGVAGDDLTT